MWNAKAILRHALLILSAGPLAAADGDPDNGFWGDGKIYLSGTGNYEVSAVVVAPDDRVVVVGTRNPETGGSEWYWRALADSATGTGSTCYFFPPGGASQGRAYAAAFDPAGRLLVAGAARYGSDRLAVARFSFPDCTLDSSFDGDGYWTLDIPGGLESVQSIAIDPIGWIALGGYQNNGTDTDMVVALITTSGGLVNSFSGNGWLTLDPSAAQIDDGVWGIAFDASHRVIAAGTTHYGTNGTNGDWIVARFTLAGALDPAFDGDGLARIAFDLGGTSARHDTLFGLARDPNSGKLLLCGSAQTATDTELAVARLTPNGVLDTSFSGDGKFHHALGGGQIRLTEVAVDGLGRVLAAGYREPDAGNADLLAVQLTPGGALDSSYSGNGWAIVPFDIGPTVYVDDYGQAMTLQSGRMVVAGEVLINTDFDYRPGLVRLDASLVFADGFESSGFSQWSAALGFPQQ